MSYEKQLLIELETKKDAIQDRLDHMLNEAYTQFEMSSLEAEWERLMDRINDLKEELSI
jgi:polyhydroxyalkanoate synthesis regulator phasin